MRNSNNENCRSVKIFLTIFLKGGSQSVSQSVARSLDNGRLLVKPKDGIDKTKDEPTLCWKDLIGERQGYARTIWNDLLTVIIVGR